MQGTPQFSTGPRAIGLLVAVSFLLALQTIVAKVAVSHAVPMLSFLTVCILTSGTVLLVFSKRPKMTPALWRYCVISGALYAFPNALGFVAVGELGAGFVALVFSFTSLVTWVISVTLGVERPTMIRIIAVLIALAGGCLIAMSKASGGDAPLGWVLIAMTFPVIIGIGNVFRTMHWPAGVAPLFLAAVMLIFGGLTVLPFAVILEGQAGIIGPWEIYLAEIAVMISAYILYFQLQRLAGPVYLSQIGGLIALFGAVIAVLFLGETLPSLILPAGVLIALGIVLFHRGGAASS